MRYMPSRLSDGTLLPEATDWDAGVRAIVGRDLSDAEESHLADMRDHNWTMIVAAEDLLGRRATAEEMQRSKLTNP